MWMKEKCQEPQDYVYLKWQFKASFPEKKGQHLPEKEKSNIINSPGLSNFENVQTWLQSQDSDINSCNEIYCDCCDAIGDNVLYSCVDVRKIEVLEDVFQQSSPNVSLSRGNSDTSLYKSELSFSDDDFSDVSYYSLQLRQKSTD